jgi:hypothetical protein
MRRRVVCPRSHPASLFARGLSVRFAMARGIFRGDTPGPPMSPFARRCAPTEAPPPGSLRLLAGPTPCLAAARGGAAFGSLRASAGPRSPAARGLIGGRGGRGGACLRGPLRPWRRIFASDAVVVPHLRFGTGSGAASPFYTLPWRPTLGSIPPATAGFRSCPPWRRPRCRCALGGAATTSCRPLFTSRTLVTLRLRHTAISPIGVTVRGQESHPGALACPLFLAGMRALGAIHNRAHIP